MSNVTVCRVCLAGNLKTHTLSNSPLQAMYKQLTNHEFSTDDGRPDKVCFVCRWQLQRFIKFMDKSVKSEEILTQLFHHGIKILPETMSILNQGIQHEFSITAVESLTYNGKKLANAAKAVTIKQEMVAEDSLDDNLKMLVITGDAVLCRVCLAVGIRSHTIKGTPLQAIYERLTNNRLCTDDGRSETICYICYSHLVKCGKFLSRSRRSEKILSELARHGIQLTDATITILNSKMKSNFVASSVETFMYIPDDAFKPIAGKSKRTKQKAITHHPITIKEETFSCDACGHVCPTSVKLDKHKRFHDHKRQLSCDICLYRFKTVNGLRSHTRTHDLNHECGQCSKTFPKVAQLKMHMLCHLSSEVYPCDYCEKVLKDGKSHRDHINKAHSGRKLTCVKCNLQFINQQRLNDHTFKIHAGSCPYYICDICQKRFIKKVFIKRHMVVHFKLSNYKCEVCAKVFHRWSTLKQHRYTHADKKPYECDVCGKTFIIKNNLKLHMMNHTGEKPYSCDICDKTCRDKHLLKLHLITHTQARLSCNFCDKTYVSKFAMKEHTLAHKTGVEKPYGCDRCGQKFTTKHQLKYHVEKHLGAQAKRKACDVCNKKVTNLKQHMISHTDVKAFICDLCGMKFGLRVNIISHLSHHTGVRPYPCKICNKRFARKLHVKTHMSTHTGAKPHACSTCGKSFAQPGALLRHGKVHSGEKPYKCEICKRKFSEKRSLHVHKSIAHTTRQRNVVCDYCNKVYANKTDIIRHIKTHKGQRMYRCEFCKQTYHSLDELTRHCKIHKDVVSTQCFLCKKFYASGLARHYYTAHSGFKPYACNICEEAFTSIYTLNGHINL